MFTLELGCLLQGSCASELNADWGTVAPQSLANQKHSFVRKARKHSIKSGGYEIRFSTCLYYKTDLNLLSTLIHLS